MPPPEPTPRAPDPSLRELCPEQIDIDLLNCRASRNAIHMATVYECESPKIAAQRLAGSTPGFVYQRDGHPNAVALSEKCRRLHAAEHAVMAASGMAATSLALLSTLESGDHVLLSERMYGGTTVLVEQHLSRLGIDSTRVDTDDPRRVQQAFQANTRVLIVETISNPMLHVAPLAELADTAHEHEAILLVDNTFASPIVCRPIELGADLVVESLTKIMNGHGDVTMGLLCGQTNAWERVDSALSTYGMTTSPFECWLAERGVATLFLRMKASCETASELAQQLLGNPALSQVIYPGLDAARLAPTLNSIDGQPLYGNMVTLELAETGDPATSFIERLNDIPFCPSLGDLTTTLSHPSSSSHRNLSAEAQQKLGFGPNTIRLSVGLEGVDYLLEALLRALGTKNC